MSNIINHIFNPVHKRVLPIHEWQLRACNGDLLTAALLSYLESFAQNRSPLNDKMLIQIKLKELKMALFELIADSKFARSITRLINKKFISLHENPFPEKSGEVMYICFYREAIDAWMREYNK